MIQSSDYLINCKVEALNEWTSLSNPTDVSEANSFLWIGKTQHIIKNLKTNVRNWFSHIHCVFQAIVYLIYSYYYRKSSKYPWDVRSFDQACTTWIDSEYLSSREEMSLVKMVRPRRSEVTLWARLDYLMTSWSLSMTQTSRVTPLSQALLTRTWSQLID